MMLFKQIFISLVLVCCLVTLVAAQPAAVIVVEDWSPYELILAGRTTPPSTGLTVVGKGELVYLLGKEAAAAAVNTFAWSITSTPVGSAAVLDSTNKARTTFRPDLEGQYTIQLAITTASGNANASVTITAAQYVGAGANFAQGQCGGCHPGNTASWMDTGHATFFEHQIDGGDDPATSHYNQNCIQCHTVGYDTTAVNGGFDDAATAAGWVFPDTLQPGNWDDIVANFPTVAAKANIQCENCHGPGSQHKGDKTKIALTVTEGVCGRCHEDGNYHVKNTQWKNSKHGSGDTWENEGIRDILPTEDFRTQCANCHSPAGFIQRVDPASEALDRIGLTGQPLSCQGCHDPHDATNPHQIRLPIGIQLASGPEIEFGGLGRLCMRCHQDRRVGGGEAYAKNPTRTYRGPHHSNQTDMLAGVPEAIITFGMVLPNSTHKDVVENSCVDCHMAETGRNDLGEHSWAMHTTEIVNGDTLEINNVTACKECHDPNMTSFEDMKARADHDGDGKVEAVQAEVEGLLHDVAMLLPPVGQPTVSITDPLWNTKEGLFARRAAWNYFWVEYDHSLGIHNYQFTVALLKNTLAVLKFGALDAGVVSSVTDVPNDQGKQVRVVWTRFGGDGISDNPVRNYAIWRKIEETATNGKAVKTLATLNVSSTEIEKLAPGTQLALQDELWDYVGSVPAAAQDNYSAIVPTLYDSTASGKVLSTFRVSGHTNITAIYAVTLPATGYSIDNLVPGAPTNVAGQLTEAGVSLEWDESLDSDFSYFAVYRNTVPFVNVGNVQPFAKVSGTSFVDPNVTIGRRYFYRLLAYDFSGNKSALSNQVSFNVTSVVNSSALVPEEYALEQNYPNPFNPSTTIKFAVKEAGRVELEVYNAVGAKVMTVLNEQMPAGTHNVTISAADLTSGVYFYRIRVNNFSDVKKMVLIK